MKIFVSMSEQQHYHIDDQALKAISQFLTKEYILRDKRFSNGRMVRNLFEKVITNQANRIVMFDLNEISDKNLSTILIEDVDY